MVNAGYCMLVNEWGWLGSQVCLFCLKVHLGDVLESEFRQKGRYGALNACNMLEVVTLNVFHKQSLYSLHSTTLHVILTFLHIGPHA